MTWREKFDEFDQKADYLDLILLLGVVCLAANLLVRIVVCVFR